MSNKPLVMIIEDEPKIAQILVDFLTLDGFSSVVLNDGMYAVDAIKKQQPAAVILDLMLPNKDGLTICREVRTFSKVPILMLTARVDEIDRLNGLGIGADDYVCKPFSPREVVARIQAILRRVTPEVPDTQHTLAYRGLSLDLQTFTCHFEQQLLDLTPVEFRLLAALLQKPRVVFSRDSLMTACYDDDRVVSHRTIDSHLKNLRTKLHAVITENPILHSVYGVGYKLE